MGEHKAEQQTDSNICENEKGNGEWKLSGELNLMKNHQFNGEESENKNFRFDNFSLQSL